MTFNIIVVKKCNEIALFVRCTASRALCEHVIFKGKKQMNQNMSLILLKPRTQNTKMQHVVQIGLKKKQCFCDLWSTVQCMEKSMNYIFISLIFLIFSKEFLKSLHSFFSPDETISVAQHLLKFILKWIVIWISSTKQFAQYFLEHLTTV